MLAQYFRTQCAGKEITENPINADGLHSGRVEIKHNELQLHARDGGGEILALNLSRVKNCAVPTNNEVCLAWPVDSLLLAA